MRLDMTDIKMCTAGQKPGSADELINLFMGTIMTTRIASILITISVFALAGCADGPDVVVHHYTSGQISANGGQSDVTERPLTETQVNALTTWINTRGGCSGMSANIPDRPSLDVQMQEASGQSSHISVYTRDDGSATAYLYQGNRLVPMRCPLTTGDVATLKSALNAQ
jgi:uncharacterized lipoprotein YajG